MNLFKCTTCKVYEEKFKTIAADWAQRAVTIKELQDKLEDSNNMKNFWRKEFDGVWNGRNDEIKELKEENVKLLDQLIHMKKLLLENI